MNRIWLIIGLGFFTASTVLVPVSAEATKKYRCKDFTSHAEAQRIYEQAGGPKKDPHKLDHDGDGVACEGLLKKSKKKNK